MLDFLQPQNEESRKLLATNYSIAFKLIPAMSKKVCKEGMQIEILFYPELWGSVLKEVLKDDFCEGKLPKAVHYIREKGRISYDVVVFSYDTVGMVSEPVCTLVILDLYRKDFSIFSLERSHDDKYVLCRVEDDKHYTYDIEFSGDNTDEFLRTAEKMGIDRLEGNTDVLATFSMHKYAIKSGLDVLENYKPLSVDARCIAAFFCGSLMWEKGGSREEPNPNWHIFRTMAISYDLWKVVENKESNKKAEQMLDLFLKINDNPNLIYQCIYEHNLHEDITSWHELTPNSSVPSDFEKVYQSCKNNVLQSLKTYSQLKSTGVVYDPEVEGLKKADNFFYSQVEKIKKIAVLVGLKHVGVLLEDWVEKSAEELIWDAGFTSIIGESNGVKHLIIPSLAEITDDDLHKKYQEYDEKRRRYFIRDYGHVIQNHVFRDNKYRLFPKKDLSGWATWCYDDKVKGTFESVQQQAQAGNYEAYNNLAIKCRDDEKRPEYFRIAAEHGSANAQQNLWAEYYNEKNFEEANKWMLLAAQGGNEHAMYNLATCAYWGINMEKDLKTALKYYRKVAVMDWDSLVKEANLSYWVVKEECEKQHIDISDIEGQTESDDSRDEQSMYYLPKIDTDEEWNNEVSWPLAQFCAKFSQPRYVDDFKREDGSTFSALSFESTNFDPNDVRDYIGRDGATHKSGFVMVTFSPLLPDTSMEYIINNHKDLKIVKIPPRNGSQYPTFELRPINLLGKTTGSKTQTEETKKEHIENFELPNGALYTGEAIRKYGTVEITGQGCSVNKDGSSYNGAWQNGRPCGYGIYKFADGDFHKGFFNDKPNGVGYTCLNSKNAMKIGIFRDAIMNGWAIGMLPGGRFNCSFVRNGQVIQDHTDDFNWMVRMLQNKVFASYKGNMVQCSPEKEYIRFGAPNRTGKNGIIEFERSAIGFTFTNDGKMYVGMVNDVNNLNGTLVMCTPDHKIICGTWKNNVLVKEESMEEVDAYTDIQFTFEKSKPMNINDEPTDLPF